MIEDVEFTLSLIRHGESETNATPDLMGQTAEVPLTEKGREQARALRARFLKSKEIFDHIYSSPYVRALTTCKLALPNPEQKIVLAPALREYDAGEWLLGSRSKLLTPEVKTKMNVLNQMFLPPNGESAAMVERRAGQWVDEEILYNKYLPFRTRVLREKGEPPVNIACFSHGMTIKALLHYIVGFDKSFTWKIQIDNTSITRFAFGKDGWKLLCVNDCSHTEGL